MTPPAYSVFDANGNFLAAVVQNGVGPGNASILLAQVLKDNGNGPVTLGGQVAVAGVNTLDFSKPLGTNDPDTQWVVSGDLIVNTPAWPSLLLKYGFKVVPLILVGTLPS